MDAQTRMDLEDLVLPLRDQFGISIVFVTHDVDEAVYLSDRVVDIPLPFPREQHHTKEDPAFARLRGEVLDLVRNRTSALIEG